MIPTTPKSQQTSTPRGTLLPLENKLKEFPKTKPKKVILLSGPTACGKSALAILLAELLGGEIISADSMQVYRGMDIGTAKVSKEEQEHIPHHLIDIRDVQEDFNVVDFYYEARQCCESILARDKVPIICGGTGFYFHTFLYGPPSGPPSVPEIRHEIEMEMQVRGSQSLYEELKRADPEYAETITPNDKHKIIRALEIIHLTGEKVSALEWKEKALLKDYACHCWFIYRPRSLLYPIIDARCEQMLELGLIDEVKELDKKGLKNNLSAAQAIGYRQCLDYLETSQTEEEYARFVTQFKTASRKLAKRQFTWFRKEQIFKWINVDIHDPETVAEIIAQEYSRLN
ncbi:MAG: tRNA dimethylallyltransferase [Chlamydiales bacterium]|nr:tRNA dimethylallyltransferase [Chlamydiales bacterium]MCH9619872.1 tRNA dimethylallyltransferase [Chlamydiales bacterium]MCH9622701.1 tRNA dimethylallyltransferase [Chlamydiales bacterium]